MKTIEDKIESYLDNREKRGFCRHPFDRYLAKFNEYVCRNDGSRQGLMEDDVKGWLCEGDKELKKDISIKASAVRGLGKYLRALGEEAYILPHNYAPFKATFTPHILSDDELARFFAAVDGLSDMTGNTKTGKYTDYYTAMAAPVMFRLLYTCGLRPNEGRHLKRDNIDFETGIVKIVDTKFHKDRRIVMSDDMLALCRKYDQWRAATGIKSEYFFINQVGQYFGNNWMCFNVQKCWKRANPDVKPVNLSSVRAYDLRHRFATENVHRWLDEKADLNQMLQYLKVYMGHTELKHTAYYMHILPEKLARSPGVDWELLDSLIPEVAVWEN
jgi:integrase